MTDASAANAGGTLCVRADESGRLIDLHIDRSELRFGGDALAASILALCADATASATQRHRAALLHEGIASEVVDRVAPESPTTPAAPRSWTSRP